VAYKIEIATRKARGLNWWSLVVIL